MKMMRTVGVLLTFAGMVAGTASSVELPGGRVTVGSGVHDCGTLWLRSGVELHLEKGAVLRGPSDWRAYDDVDDPRIAKRPEGSKKVFIAAFDAENVAITGEGTIDGQGLCFYPRFSS